MYLYILFLLEIIGLYLKIVAKLNQIWDLIADIIKQTKLHKRKIIIMKTTFKNHLSKQSLLLKTFLLQPKQPYYNITWKYYSLS